MKKIITVDGPAGSGKEKISKYIAKTYNLMHIDSGLLYRKLAYVLEKNKIKAAEKQKIKVFIKNVKKLSINKNSSLRREKIGDYDVKDAFELPALIDGIAETVAEFKKQNLTNEFNNHTH